MKVKITTGNMNLDLEIQTKQDVEVVRSVLNKAETDLSNARLTNLQTQMYHELAKELNDRVDTGKDIHELIDEQETRKQRNKPKKKSKNQKDPGKVIKKMSPYAIRQNPANDLVTLKKYTDKQMLKVLRKYYNISKSSEKTLLYSYRKWLSAIGKIKSEKPIMDTQKTAKDKGTYLGKYQQVKIYQNIINEMKDADPDSHALILREYHPSIKKSTFKTYLNTYKRYLKKYINKPSLKEISEKRRKQKWKELRGPTVDYYGTTPIHRNIYTEVKKLQYAGKLNKKNIVPIIKKHMPGASDNTIKKYTTDYRTYTLSKKEPNDRKYDKPTGKDRNNVLHAIHTLFNHRKPQTFDSILTECELTPTKLRNTLKTLVKENKVKKENGNYYLKISLR